MALLQAVRCSSQALRMAIISLVLIRAVSPRQGTLSSILCPNRSMLPATFLNHMASLLLLDSYQAQLRSCCYQNGCLRFKSEWICEEDSYNKQHRRYG